VAGPPVALETDGSPLLSFESPDVLEPVTLTFSLRAHDGALLSPASRVDVAVTAPDPTALDAGGGPCVCKYTGARTPFGGASVGLGAAALALLAARRRARQSS
jgi:hypothetical protein